MLRGAKAKKIGDIRKLSKLLSRLHLGYTFFLFAPLISACLIAREFLHQQSKQFLSLHVVFTIGEVMLAHILCATHGRLFESDQFTKGGVKAFRPQYTIKLQNTKSRSHQNLHSGEESQHNSTKDNANNDIGSNPIDDSENLPPRIMRFRSIEVVDVVAIINSPRAQKPKRTVDFRVPNENKTRDRASTNPGKLLEKANGGRRGSNVDILPATHSNTAEGSSLVHSGNDKFSKTDIITGPRLVHDDITRNLDNSIGNNEFASTAPTPLTMTRGKSAPNLLINITSSEDDSGDAIIPIVSLEDNTSSSPPIIFHSATLSLNRHNIAKNNDNNIINHIDENNTENTPGLRILIDEQQVPRTIENSLAPTPERSDSPPPTDKENEHEQGLAINLINANTLSSNPTSVDVSREASRSNRCSANRTGSHANIQIKNSSNSIEIKPNTDNGTNELTKKRKGC